MTDKPLAELLRGIEDDGVYGEWDDFREIVRRLRKLAKGIEYGADRAREGNWTGMDVVKHLRPILDGGSG